MVIASFAAYSTTTYTTETDPVLSAQVVDDFGNTIKEAELISINQAISGSIENPGDIDYFKFTIDNSMLFEVYSSGATDTFGSLYDSTGQQICCDDDSGGLKNFRFSQVLEPGTYYISVNDFYSERTGSYVLNTIATSFSVDDFGNSIDTAFSINMDGTVSGKIDVPGDIDYFKIKIDKEVILKANSEGNTDTFGAFMDASGNQILYDDDSGTDRNFMFKKQVVPGIYYISVRHYYQNKIGAYVLNVNCTEVISDDYGNDITSATEINTDEVISGGIQYSGDTDFMEFTLANNCSIDAFTLGSTDTYGTIYNQNGVALVSNDDDGIDKNFEIKTNLPPGVYYLEVRDFYANKTGEYTLQINTSALEDNLIVPLDAGDSNTCGFAYDGLRFAYIGCNISPARIVKFDVKEMKRVSSIDLPSNENRNMCVVADIITISPDTVIHASYTNPCVFTKIDVNSMQITGTLIGKVGNMNFKLVRSMVYDGQFVYAATCSTPGRIIKFDPVTMTIIASYTFPVDEASEIHKITLIGDYIVGVSDRDIDSDAKIFRINKNDFSTQVDSIYISGVANYHSICNDGNFVYAATDTNPIRVVKIDALASEMTYEGTFVGDTDVDVGNYSIMCAKGNLIVGTWNFVNQDRIIKINTINMEKISSRIFLPSFPADLHYIDGYIFTCTDNAIGNVVRMKF